MASKLAALPTKFLPQLVNGRWQKPVVSARYKAVMRKRAILEGKYSTNVTDPSEGWNPYWDKMQMNAVMKPPKGHKKARTLSERVAKITKLMEDQDQKKEELRKKLRAERAKKRDISWFDRVFTAPPQY